MEKQFVSLTTALLAVSCIFFSCSSTVNKNTRGLRTDSICLNETAHLFQDTAKPACNLVVNFCYFNDAVRPSTKDSLNSYFQYICFGEEYEKLTPQEAVEAYKQAYIDEYRTDLEPMYREEEEELKDSDTPIGSWYSYYKHIDSRVQTLTDELLVYKFSFDEYTGGAHGIYMTYFFNIDLQRMQSIKLNDIFAGDYQEALTEMLWNQLMADNDVTSRQELEDMGYAATGELQPTENFYLTHEGITFYYNVYEFTPYAMGPTEISLPWAAVSDIRNENFKIKL